MNETVWVCESGDYEQRGVILVCTTPEAGRTQLRLDYREYDKPPVGPIIIGAVEGPNGFGELFVDVKMANGVTDRYDFREIPLVGADQNAEEIA